MTADLGNRRHPPIQPNARDCDLKMSKDTHPGWPCPNDESILLEKVRLCCIRRAKAFPSDQRIEVAKLRKRAR